MFNSYIYIDMVTPMSEETEGKCTERVLQTPILHYSTNFLEGPRHSWNPGLFVDVSWSGGPVGKLSVTKAQQPSQNFVEGIFG